MEKDIKKYSLTKEEKDYCDWLEDTNAHSLHLVYLCKIIKREFPKEEDRANLLIQAEWILELHNKICYMPYRLFEYRESIFNDCYKFINNI